ncbi:MAG: tol-pal system protein YbgF [Deltaproteobacteria bacterium]
MIMGIRPSVLCVLAALLISGCAGLDREKADGLVRDVDNLKASLQETNSRVEHLNNRVNLLQEKVESYTASNKDVPPALPAAPPEGLRVVPLSDDAVIKAQDSKAKKAGEPPPDSVAAGKDTEETAETPEALYKKGHELYAAGNFPGARMVFLKIVDGYPAYVLADNALYWAAETYYSERDFTNAIVRFKEVAQRYPDRNKAPDAVLKIGLSYIETGDTGMAREYLERVIKKYPGSEAADMAKKTFDDMAKKRNE